jgi:glucan phosphoethanolaminetransferase (alkaline phosphatase superfamily)
MHISTPRGIASAALKLLAVAAFVYMTNSGVVERVILLIDQERYRGLTLYAGLWGFCIGCVLIVAFHPRLHWRLLWATVIGLTTFAGYSFMLVTDSQLTVFHIISMWTAIADMDRAVDNYSGQLWQAAGVVAFGFVALVARPPRLHPAIARGTSLLSLTPAIPIVALSAMITIRIGDDTVAMPQQFVPAAIGAVASAKLAAHEQPAKQPLTTDPIRPPAARHIVLLVDESITSRFVSFRGDSPVTPFLARSQDRFADFGEASSASNCSAETNAILRFGASRSDLRGSMTRSPYLWEFARRAGFRTVYLDAAASHIKNPAQLQNYMTLREKALIDEYATIDAASSTDLDLALSARIAEILSRPEPHFIFATKNGAHFPYDKSYPVEEARFRPTESESGGDVTSSHRLNSYRNAVRWSVDVFFADFLGRTDLSRAAVVYTSDHGQNLELGAATHCSVQGAHPDEGRVPLFVLSGIDDLKIRFAAAARLNFDRANHFAIFPTLLELFGYRPRDHDPGYGPSLFEPIDQPREFVSGDIMGIFSEELWWNPIVVPGPKAGTVAPAVVAR